MQRWINRWKARFKRFMGWDLPKRRLDLNFELLPPNRRGDKPRISSIAFSKLQKEHDGNRIILLTAILDEIKALNRYSASPSRRLSRSSVALKWYYPLALECINQYSKEAGVPDDDERRDSLDLASDIARGLATSYKLVYQHYYDSSRFWYAQHRKRIFNCAFRILELVKLEQRLRGLRYQQLPSRAWQDVNTLFTILTNYDSIDFPAPLLDSKLRDTKTSKTGSPHDLFTAIHTFALLDHSSWPVEQHRFIDTYRESLDKPVTASLSVNDLKTADSLYASAYHAGPPLIELPSKPSGPAIHINCSYLAKSIRRDYRDLLKSKVEDNKFIVPPLLAPLQDAYQVSIASLMRRSVNKRMWTFNTDRPGDPIKGLHIYAGFTEIEQYLLGIFNTSAEYRKGRQLKDSLADRSALFGEDHTADQESLWHVIYSDSQKFGLQTQETAYTTRMSIGTLLSYGVGSKDRKRPRLGMISRIYRPNSGSVMLEITRLANFAEPVKVQKDIRDTKNKAKGKPAVKTSVMIGFMVHDKQFGWGMLLPNQDQVWQKTAVIMQRETHKIPFKLGKVIAVTQHFILFELPKQFQGLGEPKYPDHSKQKSPHAFMN